MHGLCCLEHGDKRDERLRSVLCRESQADLNRPAEAFPSPMRLSPALTPDTLSFSLKGFQSILEGLNLLRKLPRCGDLGIFADATNHLTWA